MFWEAFAFELFGVLHPNAIIFYVYYWYILAPVGLLFTVNNSACMYASPNYDYTYHFHQCVHKCM